MNIEPTSLPGVLLIEPKVFSDDRGNFQETYRRERYEEAGIKEEFVQDNLSFSVHGVLRGLHFQNPDCQAKLVYVLRGEIYDVAVDIRSGSPTFGQWTAVTLSVDNRKQLYVPVGFAHGFLVTSPEAFVAYKVTRPYHPTSEGTVLWNDPDIGIPWPTNTPILAPKDAAGRRLQDIPPETLQFPE